MLSDALAKELIQAAQQAADLAYAPYSQFHVGAALLLKDKTVITGVNVENVSYGLTLCAERVAIHKAISEGYREFKAIAVWAAPENTDSPTGHVTPCGACRQVMAEFFAPETSIIYKDPKGSILQRQISELLPEAFS